MLLKDLEQRQIKNPSYSRRAFARTLNVSPAFLTQIFSFKRNLSQEMGEHFAQKLQWPKRRKRLFLSLIQYQKASTEEAKSLILDKIDDLSELDFIDLEHDQFKLVAEWFHFAILELTEVDGFEANEKWIAQRLGISTAEAASAITRLKKIGLLNAKGSRLTKAKKDYRIPPVPSEAIRTFHKSHLMGAGVAMEKQKFDQRYFSGLTISFATEQMPEIQELVREFRNKVNRLTATKKQKDSVYQLAIQFFRLDKETK